MCKKGFFVGTLIAVIVITTFFCAACSPEPEPYEPEPTVPEGYTSIVSIDHSQTFNIPSEGLLFNGYVGGGFAYLQYCTAESEEIFTSFDEWLLTSEYYVSGGDVTENMSAYPGSDKYRVLIHDGYGYIFWLNTESNIVCIRQLSLFFSLMSNYESVDAQYLSVPLPFSLYTRDYISRGYNVVFSDNKFVFTWSPEQFDGLCLIPGVSSEYRSLKSFYRGMSKNYVVGFEDAKQEIYLNICRDGLYFGDADIFGGTTLTVTDDGVMLEIDVGEMIA